MSRQDLTEQLHNVVDSILSEHDLEVLEEYWELAELALRGHPVRRFYVRTEGGCGNVAILTDSVVADIDGDDTDEQGHFAVCRISALSDIGFYKEQVPTVPDSDGAELVIVANTPGDHLEFYWIAKTEQEAEYLLEFGRSLLALIGGKSD